MNPPDPAPDAVRYPRRDPRDPRRDRRAPRPPSPVAVAVGGDVLAHVLEVAAEALTAKELLEVRIGIRTDADGEPTIRIVGPEGLVDRLESALS